MKGSDRTIGTLFPSFKVRYGSPPTSFGAMTGVLPSWEGSKDAVIEFMVAVWVCWSIRFVLL